MDVPLYKNYNVGWLKDEIRDQLRTTDLLFDLSDFQLCRFSILRDLRQKFYIHKVRIN